MAAAGGGGGGGGGGGAVNPMWAGVPSPKALTKHKGSTPTNPHPWRLAGT